MKNLPIEIQNAEVIFVSHSGGKDSQAMLAHLIKLGLKEKLVIIHSDLGEMEWEPMHGFIEANSFGLPVYVVKPELDFFEICRKYNRLPSGQARFCTTLLKTTPICKFIHAYMSERGLTKAINATGVRSEESKPRAKKIAKIMEARNDNFAIELSDMSMPKKYAGHVIFDWLPIFDFSLDKVWLTIANAGQTPHKIYSKGYSRLSCVFCVLGKIGEHQMAAKEKPELFDKMAALEIELGRAIRLKQEKGIKKPKFLTEYCKK